MELPIKTVVMLVVLLVLVSRGGSNFTDLVEDQIGIAGDTSECERLCWECCRGNWNRCDSDSPTDVPYTHPEQNCGCFVDGKCC